jgi:hypothetical protein
MEEIPMEWVDKIFDIMAGFFMDAWTKGLESPGRLDIMKSIWRTGLYGLSKEDIRLGLSISKKMAANQQQPPNVIEFYHYSKGVRFPPPAQKREERFYNRELARKSLDEMKRYAKR